MEHAAAQHPRLILVLGDHGMSDAGSHGGASVSEVMTPFVFVGLADDLEDDLDENRGRSKVRSEVIWNTPNFALRQAEMSRFNFFQNAMKGCCRVYSANLKSVLCFFRN